MNTPIEHHPESQRFEARLGAQRAVCDYVRSGGVAVLHHTEVPHALRGQGIAGDLVAAALAWARAEGLRVRPSCSYVAAYMRRHPETHDLLEGRG